MVSLFQIGALFGRYANLTLGGGSATSATIYREIVDRRHWVTQSQFTLSFALGRLTPGTNLLAFCTGIGWLLRGLPGALVALLAASIPCAVLVVMVTALFERWEHNSTVQTALAGAIAAAVAITVKTCWTIAKPHFKAGTRLKVVLIAAAAFALHVAAGLPAIDVLILAAIVGFFLPERAA